MIIRVRYKNDIFDMVSDSMLQQHIETGKISMFYRFSEHGRIVIGKDPVRKTDGSPAYEGPERRASGAALVLQS